MSSIINYIIFVLVLLCTSGFLQEVVSHWHEGRGWGGFGGRHRWGGFEGRRRWGGFEGRRRWGGFEGRFNREFGRWW